ncbi:MAG: tetratricopeptide repeat protein [Verrucomicrobiaceae bacterium]|nr:tetratricopeptide repeat protein [Verrucomicrobiaceae bacterium]
MSKRLDQPRKAKESAAKPGRFTPAWWQVCVALALLFLSYSPALNGTFVWDDDAWTERLLPLFQSWDGLLRIWKNDPLLQQYYPLTATTFWIDWNLWGNWTLPYHVFNVLSHGVAAFLLGFILARLEVRGAWLAALIFAFHPVMVESVAWITERKNVLSLALTLGSLCAYGHYRYWWESPGYKPRPMLTYCLAVALFVAALLSKVTAYVLPPVMLLIPWWKHGRGHWRDWISAAPFFVIAAVVGSLVWWMEMYHVGAEGEEFRASIAERVVSAGRAFWFYPWKLLLPINLCFIYPDWREVGVQWHDWLWLAAAAIILVLAFRNWNRGLQLCLALYLIALFPVSGLLNVYGALFSPVWDHWAYVPGIAVLIPLAAWLVRWRLIAAAFVLALAALTLINSRQYSSREALWLATIDKNPRAWIALNNHGLALAMEGKLDEGIEFLKRAIAVRPVYPKAYNNLAGAYMRQKDYEAAVEASEIAATQDPTHAGIARMNIGGALFMLGRKEEALEQFYAAVYQWPTNAMFWSNLAQVQAAAGEAEKAQSSLAQAQNLKGRQETTNPTKVSADDHFEQSEVMMRNGQQREAVARLISVVDADSHHAKASNALADVYLQRNQPNKALRLLQTRLHDDPSDSLALFNLAVAQSQLGQFADSKRSYESVLKLAPKHAGALNNLAWLLSTCPDEAIRDGKRAQALAQAAIEEQPGALPVLKRTLAAALAEAGDYVGAKTVAEEALAAAGGNQALEASLKSMIDAFTAGQPIREKLPSP